MLTLQSKIAGGFEFRYSQVIRLSSQKKVKLSLIKVLLYLYLITTHLDLILRRKNGSEIYFLQQEFITFKILHSRQIS